MPAASRAHYAGDFPQRRARLMWATATNNPALAYVEVMGRRPDLVWLAELDRVVCWRCHEPLATCGPNRNGRHKTGTRAKWHAGHTVDADPSEPIVPECSPCNTSRGAVAGNMQRPGGSNETSRVW